MREYIIYALLAAFFAALVPIFGKLGLKDVNPTLATAVRAVIMALFLAGVALAIFLSWLVLGSRMNLKTALGAVLIVIGAILVSL
ncbi:EamA family transporter [Thermococcus sp.]